jgi:deoxyinosine 3'endonuclease (endonuclease V)
VNPLYISIGHKIDLPTAIDLVLECCRGFRLPEPTRFAHQAAAGNLTLPAPASAHGKSDKRH